MLLLDIKGVSYFKNFLKIFQNKISIIRSIQKTILIKLADDTTLQGEACYQHHEVTFYNLSYSTIKCRRKLYENINSLFVCSCYYGSAIFVMACKF